MASSKKTPIAIFKKDILHAIEDVAREFGDELPPKHRSGDCRISYEKCLGKGQTFDAVGQTYRRCTNGEHPHAYRKQLVIGSPRPSSRMLQWLSFMRAMHDMFPSGKYNPKDPATEDEVEAVLRILRAALATVRVAFTNYHETGQWEEPNLEFADPILIPASSPKVSSTALPLLPSLLSRSSPPPATQPRTCVEWLLTPTKRLSKHPMRSGGSPSTPSTSSTVTSLFSPVSMVSPGTTPDTSTSKSTLDPFATKGKRKYQSTEGTPTRPTKKPKFLGTIDLTTEDCDAGVEDYDADVEDNTKWMVRMKKGKMRAFGDLLRGPCNEGAMLVPDSDDENEENIPMPPCPRF